MIPRFRWSAAASTILVVIGITRIGFSYRHTAQTFDEPCHVAAGIEFLDRNTYTLDPVHPPLSRIAIALPIYLAGERYPQLTAGDPGAHNYNIVGNHILHDSGRFERNLTLARIGVLPFFVLGALIVYAWTLRLAGERSAVFAVFLCTTTPTILAFSSIAYTDIVAASTQIAAMFAFTLWLEDFSRRRTLWLAVALGFAFTAKLTSGLFLPAAFIGMYVCWLLRGSEAERAKLSKRVLHLAYATALAGLIVWGSYRFSVKPIQEATDISTAALPSFQNFPAFARPAIRRVVMANPRLPAPELLNGIAKAWVLNKAGSDSYLLGRTRSGGWWYFYLCALGVKLPLPLIIACASGVILCLKEQKSLTAYLPLVALLGVLLITAHVKYQVGLRHVLVCLPLIMIVTAAGLKSWLNATSWRSPAVFMLLALATWQIGESARSQGDFIAYFNELAGEDPSKVLVIGCDLDCGQDLYRLADELRARRVSRFTLAVWTSADVDQSSLPPYDPPTSDGEREGWIAVSSRAYRLGHFLHQSLPPHSFDWLNNYAPVANVGRTIKLYYIKPSSAH